MLNLKYYKGEDLYSDGDVEDDILKIAVEKINIDDIPKEDINWPIYYHLSPKRRNLLDWYPFEKNKKLLEIGAGCGALTGLFCDKLESVTAVELSKRRATIIDARCEKYDNLEIIVGNLNDIDFEEKFDYITLIGVLEYAPSFTKSSKPFDDFLIKIKKMLKKDGRLLIAIENQFGIKYFAGAREDHLGSHFSGIEGYIGVDTCKTFGKNELTSLIKEVGFKGIDYYYPYPDYKLPEAIYTDNFLPSISDLYIASPVFDSDRYVLYNEKLVMSVIIKNNMFSFFSNSFLLECK